MNQVVIVCAIRLMVVFECCQLGENCPHMFQTLQPAKQYVGHAVCLADFHDTFLFLIRHRRDLHALKRKFAP